MDIDYLLFLQNFRNSINDALTPFMEALSLYAVTYLRKDHRETAALSSTSPSSI